LAVSLAARKLQFIEVVTRHGVRYPQYLNDYDFSNITLVDGALKELTQEGRQMHYLLGRLLYKKYWAAIFEDTKYKRTLNRSLIYAKSTDTNRTIESL
jgi:hypothetical protein